MSINIGQMLIWSMSIDIVFYYLRKNLGTNQIKFKKGESKQAMWHTKTSYTVLRI